MGSTGAGLALASLGRGFAQDIDIPDTELPDGDVSLRWIDSGDAKALFLNEYFAAYQEAHPNVRITYDALPWNEIGQVVPLGIQNGNAHDVFQLPSSITPAQAVREGWIQALDDHIPDFEAWKANFPSDAFLPGINTFGGRTFSLPLTSNRRYGTHLLYNTAYLEQAGFDPSSEPLTWDTFREAARVATEQGGGSYYGLVLGGGQLPQWGAFVENLARMAGAASLGGIDLRTGRYIYASEEVVGALELLLAMRDDGSVFPGVVNLSAPQARAYMPQGAAAMILQGPWNIPLWELENPEFNFGVASQPVPNSGEVLPLTVTPGASNSLYLYANSQNGAVVGDMFHYLGTLEGQKAWASIVGVADGPIFPEALEGVELSERSQQILALFDEQVRVGPSPSVRNPDVEQVFLELQAVTPNFDEVVQGLFTGQLTDVQGELTALNDRYEAELDRAIDAAQANGAEVSRDDWVFSNWDPAQDYTQADYEGSSS